MNTLMTPAQALTITVLYDNHASDSRLKAAWGFAALVEYRGQVVLFDTGGDGPTLLGNMAALGIEAARINSIVLSHVHSDHTGGLLGLLATGVRPTVYALPSFPADLKRQAGETTAVIDAAPGMEVADDIFTTGEVSGPIPEQALAIKTSRGLVVLTGCAHPGIVSMVAAAARLNKGPLHLVMGGFHLKDTPEAQVDDVIARLRQMGVAHIAPCHCTGESTIAGFAQAYGENYIAVGVGSIVVVTD